MLVLLNDYKEILKIEGSDEDEFIGILAEEVETLVKNSLNRELELKNYVEYYNGTGSGYLVLNAFPIQSVSKIEVYEGIDGSNQEVWTELVLGTDYDRLVVYNDYAIYLDGYTFVEGIKNYRLTYSAGYEECPLDIQNACKKIMKIAYDELKKSDSVGVASLSQNSNFSRNISFDKDDVKRILDSISFYRSINI
jgi:hypothetical protein